MKFLGDTRAYRILSLELIGAVLSLPIVIPAFAVWALFAYEVPDWLARKLRIGG